MTHKNILFQQRQLDKLWRAVRLQLSNGHLLPAEILRGTTQVEWLNRMDGNRNVSLEMTDQLAKWLGYEDFVDFSKQNVTAFSAGQPTDVPANYLIAFIILGALVVGLFGYIFYAKAAKTPDLYDVKAGNVSPADRQEIELLIKNATDFEFATYKTAPNADTSGLGQYFASDGKAYGVVVANVMDASKNKWSLNSPGNGSYFVLIDAEVKNSDGKTAEVITRENWYLDYFEPNATTSVYTYNNLSTQYYRVKKVANEWKVDLNAYPSTR